MSAPFSENGSETEESTSVRFCNRSIWWLQFATDVELCPHIVAAQTLKGRGRRWWLSNLIQWYLSLLADDMDTYCLNIILLLKFFAYLNAILLSMGDRKLSSAFRPVLTLTDNTRQSDIYILTAASSRDSGRTSDWIHEARQQQRSWACDFATECLVDGVIHKSKGWLMCTKSAAMDGTLVFCAF